MRSAPLNLYLFQRSQNNMIFHQPLIPGTLVKRYKRFLVDIELHDKSILTAYCPNTGSMRGCSTPGSRVLLSTSDNSQRKYPHTLEIIEEGKTWVGVNTGLTNGLVVEAIRDGKISELKDFTTVKQEVTTSKGTRLDILLSGGDVKTYIEVKNCSLVENRVAMFPDAVTSRGTKHLEELMKLAKSGQRAVIFYLVQRMDAERFCPAAHIDPLYAQTLMKAVKSGVEILVYQAEVTPESIEIVNSLSYSF